MSGGKGNWLALVNTIDKAFSTACSVMLDQQPSKLALMVRGWSWKYQWWFKGDVFLWSFNHNGLLLDNTRYISGWCALWSDQGKVNISIKKQTCTHHLLCRFIFWVIRSISWNCFPICHTICEKKLQLII